MDLRLPAGKSGADRSGELAGGLDVPGYKEIGRLHGITYDKDVIWQVCGTQDPKVIGYEGYTPGLVKYDAKEAAVLEIVDFVPGSCDIHDVTVRDGQLYGVDAGEHPGWPIEGQI